MSGMIKHHPSWRFGPNASIAWYPKFYYSGSRRHKIDSDKDFIFKHLNCLTEEAQREASEKYDEIFKGHLNKRELRAARYNANKFLQEFTKEHVMPSRKSVQPLEDDSKPKPKAANAKMAALIARAKEAQKAKRKKIDLGE
ncbi:hypothetical protein [Vibrio harveyi]|uniref:hypothetical protein n=1 Tax=Vibrio harveyi TaxID=669 RepID=UPI00217E2097|nr:hypothetical protein [Vibrio harveyi]